MLSCSYLWLCDRCSRVVFDESEGSNREKVRLAESGKLIVERTKKGNLLHFCSNECCRLHRGSRAGAGRLLP
jgi:hypothetical protein